MSNASSISETTPRIATADRDWIATIVVALPDPAGFALHPTAYDEAGKRLEGRGPVFAVDIGRLAVTFRGYGRDIAAAQRDVKAQTHAIVTAVGLDTASVIAVRITDGNAADRQMGEVPDCVGVGEAASLLGVSKQRIHQLAQSEEFPKPVFKLRATPVWRRSDVAHFADTRRRVRI